MLASPKSRTSRLDSVQHYNLEIAVNCSFPLSSPPPLGPIVCQHTYEAFSESNVCIWCWTSPNPRCTGERVRESLITANYFPPASCILAAISSNWVDNMNYEFLRSLRAGFFFCKSGMFYKWAWASKRRRETSTRRRFSLLIAHFSE